MMTAWLVLDRAVHFGACLLFFGVFAFDRLVAAVALAGGGVVPADYWKSRLQKFTGVLLPVILLSGIAWFLLVAANMSGLPFQQAIQPKVLATVWNQTDFGTVWKWRLIFWLASAAAAASIFIKLSLLMWEASAWIQLSLGGLLVGSLAWAGHGVEGPLSHIVADVLHLLMAGLWPAGLLPFALVLRHLRRGSEPERWRAVPTLVRRFSALSLASVSVLAATGLVNSWILVGSFANLFGQTYGRWLLVKVILFGVAVSIGAVNLLRLKPQLLAEGVPQEKTSATASQLQFNVQTELVLGAVIISVVAVLGILPPANH